MQLRHAVGPRSLESDHHNDITRQLAGLERLDHLILAIKHAGGCLNNPMLTMNSGYFDHRAPEVATQQLQASVGTEWVTCGSQHVGITTFRRRIPPGKTIR